MVSCGLIPDRIDAQHFPGLALHKNLEWPAAYLAVRRESLGMLG
jgi:hypothetical protein